MHVGRIVAADTLHVSNRSGDARAHHTVVYAADQKGERGREKEGETRTATVPEKRRVRAFRSLMGSAVDGGGEEGFNGFLEVGPRISARVPSLPTLPTLPATIIPSEEVKGVPKKQKKDRQQAMWDRFDREWALHVERDEEAAGIWY